MRSADISPRLRLSVSIPRCLGPIRRSARKYVNEEAVAHAVNAAGYDPYAHKVLGLTEMQKLLGKQQFNELLGSLITRPQGKPTLVPESDKRPAMSTITDDFKEEN